MSLENPPQHDSSHNSARASLVGAGQLDGRRIEIWMGGAHTAAGELLGPSEACDAIVFDCAGDLSVELRVAARRFLPCVFLDVEERPASYERIVGLVEGAIAECSRTDGPSRVYAICTHGMNRSGLVAGLLLRRLGFDAEDAFAAIRTARPGALSNQAFSALLAET